MIVEYAGEQYFVFTLCLFEADSDQQNESALCFKVDDGKFEWLNTSEVSIIDGRLPAGMCVYRKTTESKDGVESYICFKSDAIFNYVGDFWDDFEDNDYEALKIYHTYMNDIKELHGFPPKDLSFIEKYKPIPPKTAEEKRQEALSAELDEYLRIGEEIEESKKHSQKN